MISGFSTSPPRSIGEGEIVSRLRRAKQDHDFKSTVVKNDKQKTPLGAGTK